VNSGGNAGELYQDGTLLVDRIDGYRAQEVEIELEGEG
jgi:hypothetical protein